jgi:hypothetical protein
MEASEASQVVPDGAVATREQEVADGARAVLRGERGRVAAVVVHGDGVQPGHGVVFRCREKVMHEPLRRRRVVPVGELLLRAAATGRGEGEGREGRRRRPP